MGGQVIPSEDEILQPEEWLLKMMWLGANLVSIWIINNSIKKEWNLHSSVFSYHRW